MTAANATKILPSAGEPVGFEYRLVTQSFYGELVDSLAGGDSVVLLGPRYIGKRYVLAHVQRLLETRQDTKILSLRLSDRSYGTVSDLWAEVGSQLADKLGKLGWREPHDPDLLFDHLQCFLLTTPCHMIALVADIDALPDHLARRFLKAIRPLASLSRDGPGQFAALLTGSVGLTPLVHGANSDFNCAHQFVIQGFARDAFAVYTEKLCQASGWSLRDLSSCVDELWRLSGGNVYLLRVLFWGMLEGRRVRLGEMSGPMTVAPVSIQEIRDATKHLYSPTSTPVDLVAHMFARFLNSAEICRAAAELLRQGSTRLPDGQTGARGSARENPPTEIELSGLAVRRDGVRLEFASPIVRDIVREYLTPWRLGDYFSCEHEWDEAFHCYREAVAGGLPWVYSAVSRSCLPAAVAAFQVALRAKAPRGMVELSEFFAKGSRYLLGFDEVMTWEYHNGWRLEPTQAEDVASDEVRRRCSVLLPPPELLDEGLRPLETDVAVTTLMMGLPRNAFARPTAVILSSFRNEIPLTRDRLKLSEATANTYLLACRDAVEIETDRRQSDTRQHLLRAIPPILEAISTRHLNTQTAIMTAANALREIGFRRVMFSMISADGRYIRGVHDSRPEGEPDIAMMTDWPLNGPVQDVQQECVKTGCRVVVPDALSHPLTNQEVVGDAGIRSLVLFPIRSADGEILGTLHVERSDRQLLADNEIQGMDYFANIIGKAIGLTEGLSVLDGILREESSPLFFVNKRLEIRYLNPRAGKEINLPGDWQSAADPPLASDYLYPASLDAVKDALELDRPVLRFIRSSSCTAAWWRLDACPIHDWRGEQIGAVLDAHDFTSLRKLHSAVEEAASCAGTEELLDGVLEATKRMGHIWGRLYLICPATKQLVGHLQYGFEAGSAKAKAFAEGRVILPKPEILDSVSWVCIEKRTPCVFSFGPEREHGVEFVTDSGLQVTNLAKIACPPECRKQPGDVWVDFPLFCRRGDPVGKLCLDCTGNFGPEQLEALRTLARVVSALLSAAVKGEEEATERIRFERSAVEKAFGITAHHLQARIAALGGVCARLQRVSREYPPLQEVTEEFESLLDHLGGELTHIRKRLRPIAAERSPTDIVKLVKRTLGRQLPEECFAVMSTPRRIPADVDVALLAEAVEELACNAEKAVGNRQKLKIEVTVSTSGECCMIRFKDNGPGIPANLHKHVFDDLYSSWDKADRSTGLGLGFVRKVAEAHGGDIQIEAGGSGAVFVIEFERSVGEK